MNLPTLDNDAHHETTQPPYPERVDEHAPPAEVILNIFKATLATVPYAGGIASLISDFIPSARLRRLKAFAEEVASDLRRLQDRVNQEYLRTDDFAFVFEKAFRGAAEHPQQEKLMAFRGILINSAIRDDLSEAEKEYFFSLVGSLTSLHIRILRFLAAPADYAKDAGIPLEHLTGGFRQMFGVAIPGVDMDVIQSAFADLYRAGFINTDKSIFSTMTSAQGLHLLHGRVTPFGTRFVEFCMAP